MTVDIRSLNDIEKIEETPIEQRLRGETLYETLRTTVAEHADRVAITALQSGKPLEAGKDITFAEFLQDVHRAANMLRDLGLKKDQAITDLLPLIPVGFSLKIAAETVGLANPVNPMLEVEHLAAISSASNARILVAPGKALNPEVHAKAVAIAEANSDIHTVLLLGGTDECDGQRFRSLEDMLAQYPDEEIVGGAEGNLDDVVGYYHTGGTTGVPKLAQHTQRMRVVQAASTRLLLGYNSSDSVMLGLPMFHIAGSVICGVIPLLAGARLVLVDPRGFRSPEVVADFWKMIERHKITFTICVPTTIAAVTTVPVDGANLSTLRVFGVGGAPIPRDLLYRASDMVGQQLLEGFGMTELGSVTTFQMPNGPKTVGSIGIRAPYVEAMIGQQDEDGQIIGKANANEMGILCFRGPCVMPGYLGGRAQAETFTKDGWLISGDLARMDENGEIWITGRAKDMIIRGGHNIDPMVIEEALSLHPAVELAAAVGKPDPYAGELPMAYVQLKAGKSADPEELAAFARDNISERAAAPADVHVLDTMPMTAFGKIFKPALRRDSIQRTLTGVLTADQRLGSDVFVSVESDKELGTVALVSIGKDRDIDVQDIINELLAPYPVHFKAVVASYQNS
jgi:fatty-acyl-CoA synthase